MPNGVQNSRLEIVLHLKEKSNGFRPSLHINHPLTFGMRRFKVIPDDLLISEVFTAVAYVAHTMA